MRSWKTLSRTLLLNHSKYLVIENHTVELPDGRKIADWPWVITPDFVIVCAVTPEKQFVCLRQTKYGIKGTSLAPVGGYIEPGEDPLPAAQRELLEEAGYQAEHWIPLGQYTVDGNRGVGTAYLFLALNASCVTLPNADDLEEQELLLLSRVAIETALIGGEFKVLPWTTAVALALLQLDKYYPD